MNRYRGNSEGTCHTRPPRRTPRSNERLDDEPSRLEDLNIRENDTPVLGTTNHNSRKRPAAESGSTDQDRQSPPKGFDDAFGRGPLHAPEPIRFKPDPEDGGVYFDTAAATTTRFHDSRAKPGHAPQHVPSLAIQVAKQRGSLSEAKMILQPETWPISEEQLINEVRGIYAGLVMAEKKCVEIDQQQSQTSNNKLSDEQWQALIALHPTLLHEHHDFFLASQHPSASPALQRLASRYAMPARMWRHGIHSFLELLRHRLPDALDHMLAFIYTAYSMMALLMESVPTFEDTWIECLGDLARYRMAVEETDLRDREVWAGVARYWYNKAADKSPKVGRIQHHLAVLARPNILQQIFFYTKSLVCIQPFLNTRESIMLLFNPVLDPAESATSESSRPYHLPVMLSFVRAHGTIFTQGRIRVFIKFGDEFISYLENQIGRVGSKFREQGVHIASTNFASMLEYGNPEGILMKLFSESTQSNSQAISRLDKTQEYWITMTTAYQQKGLSDLDTQALSDTTKFISSMDHLSHTTYFTFYTLFLILTHIEEMDIPHVHVLLAFIWCLALIPEVMTYIQAEVPWRGLLEDFVMRGQLKRRLWRACHLVSASKRRSGTTSRPPDRVHINKPIPGLAVIRRWLNCCWYFKCFAAFSLVSHASAYAIGQVQEPTGVSKSRLSLGVEHLILLMLGLLAVPITFILGRKFGHARAFGISMMFTNIVNVMTSEDPLTSPLGHWVGLGLSFIFIAIFAGLLAKHFTHLMKNLGHAIALLTETGLVNYLLTRSASSSSLGVDPTDSSTKYLLPSLAFSLICWWKVGQWTKPD